MKWIKKFEGFGYSDDDYYTEVNTLLKQYNLRPVQLTHLLDFYSDMIEEYRDAGKVPKLLVDELVKKLELGSGGYPSIMVPQTNSTIKNL